MSRDTSHLPNCPWHEGRPDSDCTCAKKAVTVKMSQLQPPGGQPPSQVKFFTDEGEELTADDVLYHLEVSIDEMQQQLADAQAFQQRLQAGTPSGSFLDFTNVIPHGYDRTGPQFLNADDGTETDLDTVPVPRPL